MLCGLDSGSGRSKALGSARLLFLSLTTLSFSYLPLLILHFRLYLFPLSSDRSLFLYPYSLRPRPIAVIHGSHVARNGRLSLCLTHTHTSPLRLCDAGRSESGRAALCFSPLLSGDSRPVLCSIHDQDSIEVSLCPGISRLAFFFRLANQAYHRHPAGRGSIAIPRHLTGERVVGRVAHGLQRRLV